MVLVQYKIRARAKLYTIPCLNIDVWWLIRNRVKEGVGLLIRQSVRDRILTSSMTSLRELRGVHTYHEADPGQTRSTWFISGSI